MTGGIERLIRGKDAVVLDQLQAEIDDPRKIGKSSAEAARIEIEDIAARIEQTEGRQAADQFRAEAQNNPAVWNYFLANAEALAALRSAGDLGDPAIWRNVSLAAPGPVSDVPVDGEIQATGNRTLGDMSANTLVVTQNYLAALQQDNPTLYAIIEAGVNLTKGPVGMLGSYALDWAVEEAMEKTGLDRKAAELVVAVGTRGLAWLSDSSVAEEQALAAEDAGQEAASLTMAGVTILGITSLGKAIDEYKAKLTPQAQGIVTGGVDAPKIDPVNPTPGRAHAPDTDAEAGAGSGGVAPRPQSFTPDPNNPYIDPSKQVHIIEGEVKPGSVSGAHYANSTNIKIDPNSVTMDPGGSGVFTAKVEICCDAQGNFVPKSNSPKTIGGAPYSTFFPRDWDSQRVLDEIASAARQVLPGAVRQGSTSKSGVKIVITKDDLGKIVQAFPDWPQP